MAATFVTSELEFPDDSKSIWIPPADAKGIPADPSFARAAYENARRFFRYRSAELIDSARRSELLEAAVFRASKARKRKPVADCARYLFRTYAALVDRELAHSPRTVSTEPSILDSLATSLAARNTEGEITERIYRSEILDAMPPNARWIWERRLAGWDLDDLAEELDVSADTLYARQRRGLKDALKRLFG
jgi:hypothetical protein